MKVLWILVIALAIVVVVLGVLLVGERERVVDIAAEEAAIRALPTEWVNAVNAKDAEGMVAGFTDDAWLLPPNAPLASGKEAIRTVWSELVETPSFSPKSRSPAGATWATWSAPPKAHGTTQKGTGSPARKSG
jgi:hypothetical protein